MKGVTIFIYKVNQERLTVNYDLNLRREIRFNQILTALPTDRRVKVREKKREEAPCRRRRTRVFIKTFLHAKSVINSYGICYNEF